MGIRFTQTCKIERARTKIVVSALMILSGKRIIVGVEDKTDLSEDYDKFHEIPPFKVNIDPSLKLNADTDRKSVV